ncbi:hypothetical protein WAI453_003659 [Rhynchosporium graminicola]|uniref:Uncharacterized protein n=1 Tax=Rhynchosporium graminicola TaxID=2792576 RepID=A0A1E1JZS9_9HELO|nr:uncharacterized protein RCO7_01523 [Rhynchosporium commune]
MGLFSKDEKAPPPSYESATAQRGALDVQKSSTVTRRSPSPAGPPPPSNSQFRFPRAFGLYSASSFSGDLYIAQGADDQNPLYYISSHSGLSSQPSVVLHSSRDPNSPPHATADFHSISSTIDLTLFIGIPPGSAPQTCAMESAGMMSSSRMFQAPIPSTGQLEMFEWKGSSAAEVQMLDGRSHGKKCVRVSTGEVVAVFTHPSMSFDKRGKMAFVGDRANLGEAFEVLAVIGVIAVVEKERRARQRRNNNNRF